MEPRAVPARQEPLRGSSAEHVPAETPEAGRGGNPPRPNGAAYLGKKKTEVARAAQHGTAAPSFIPDQCRPPSRALSRSPTFTPTAAAAIYHKFLPEEGGVVWDMSAGFGGRLLGALACDRVDKYIGTDPNPLSVDGLREMTDE